MKLYAILILLDSSPLEKHGALVICSDRGAVVHLHTYTPVAKVPTQHNTTQLWLKELRTTSPTLNPALSFFRMLGISQGGPGLIGLFPLFLFTSALSCTIPRSSSANHDKWARNPEEVNVAFCDFCGKQHPATVKWQLFFLQPHLCYQIISYHPDSSSTVGHWSVLLNDGAGLTVGASLDIKRPKTQYVQ